MKRYIRTDTTYENISIPAPFDDFYHIISDETMELLTDEPAHPSLCEECEGYSIEHIAYLEADKDYFDDLSNNGIEYVELLSDGDHTFLGYAVHDRIYEVTESDLPEDLYIDMMYDRIDKWDDNTLEVSFESRVVEALQDKYSISKQDAQTIYDLYDELGYIKEMNNVDEFLKFLDDDLLTTLEAHSKEDSNIEDIYMDLKYRLDGISGKQDVNSSFDTSSEYWYLTSHGLGPGMMPRDVDLLDIVELGWDTYILLDRMLTTKELTEYDIKEQRPPEGSITRDGIVIESSEDTTSEDDTRKEIYSTTETDIQASDGDDDYDDIEDEELYLLYDRDHMTNLIANTFNVSDDIATIIYEWYDTEDAWDDFETPEEFISYVQSDIYPMIDACDEEEQKNKVSEAINSGIQGTSKCGDDKETEEGQQIQGSEDDDFNRRCYERLKSKGEIDLDEPYYDWMDYTEISELFDLKSRQQRLADEEDYYDYTHGEGDYSDDSGRGDLLYNREFMSDKIAGRFGINQKLGETIYDWYDAEGAWEDFNTPEEFLEYLDSDIYSMLDACDDETLKEEVKTAINSSTDIEGVSQPVEGMSLVYYKDYKIMPNTHSMCWEVLNQDNDLVASNFKTESEAKEYIDLASTSL